MKFGKVIGQVISTRKEGKVHGLRILIVHQLDEKMCETGKIVASIDTVNSKIDDIVLVCSSSSARQTALTEGVCTDNSIVGIVETVSSHKKDWY